MLVPAEVRVFDAMATYQISTTADQTTKTSGVIARRSLMIHRQPSTGVTGVTGVTGGESSTSITARQVGANARHRLDHGFHPGTA